MSNSTVNNLSTLPLSDLRSLFSFRQQLRLYCLALFAVFLPFAAHAQIERAGVDQLLRQSFNVEMLESMKTSLSTGFEQSASAQGLRIDTAMLEKWSAAVAAAPSAEALHQEMVNSLSEQLSPAHWRGITEWHSSTASKRLDQANLQSYKEIAKRSTPEAMNESMSIFEKLPPKRRQILHDTLMGVGGTEMMADLIIEVMLTTIAGMSSQMPEHARPNLAVLRKQFTDQRVAMRQALYPRAMADFAVIYKEVSDADLQAQLKFIQSPAGKHLYQKYGPVLVRTFNILANAIAIQFGANLTQQKT